MHAERGSAAVELALLLPVLLLAALVAIPVVLRIQEANRLDEAVGAALRYATKAAPNAVADPGMTCPDPRRRRSASEVQTFLADASGGIVSAAQVGVVVRSASGIETPDPCRGVPGSTVTVTVDWVNEVGTIGELVNGVARLVGSGDVITTSTRQLTALGVLE